MEAPLNGKDRLSTSIFPVVLGWICAASFFIASVITLLLSFDITAPAPTELPPDKANLLTGTTLFFANERERWVQLVISGCLFAAGFLALVGVAIFLSRRRGNADGGGVLMVAAFAIAGAFGAASVLLQLGAEQVALDPHICDCKYSATQIIAQGRALELFNGASEWLLYGFLALAAVGFALATFSSIVMDFGSRWRILSGVITTLLIVGLAATILGASDLNDLVVGIGGGILIPVWAVWTGSATRRFVTMNEMEGRL